MKFFSLALLVAGTSAAALKARDGEWNDWTATVTSYVTETSTAWSTVYSTIVDTATVTTTEYKPTWVTTTSTVYVTPAPVTSYVTVTVEAQKTWADWS